MRRFANSSFWSVSESGKISRYFIYFFPSVMIIFQCNVQLFSSPHPQKRINHPPVPRPLKKCFNAATVCGRPNEIPKMSPGIPHPTCIEESLVANGYISVIPGPPTSAVIAMKITGKRIVCIRDNGVVDLYKYGYTESTKSALSMYIKMYPSSSSGIGKRGNSGRSVGSGPIDSASFDTTSELSNEPSIARETHHDVISFDALDNTSVLGVEGDHPTVSVSASETEESVVSKGIMSF